MNFTYNKPFASPQVTFPASSLCRIPEVHTKEGTLHVQFRKARCYEGKPETYLCLKYFDVFFAGARVGRAVAHRAGAELEALCWQSRAGSGRSPALRSRCCTALCWFPPAAVRQTLTRERSGGRILGFQMSAADLSVGAGRCVQVMNSATSSSVVQSYSDLVAFKLSLIVCTKVFKYTFLRKHYSSTHLLWLTIYQNGHRVELSWHFVSVCFCSTSRASIKTASRVSFQLTSAAQSDVVFLLLIFSFGLLSGIWTLIATGISEAHRKTVGVFSARVPLNGTAVGQQPNHGCFAGVSQLPDGRQTVGSVVAELVVNVWELTAPLRQDIWR